MLIKKIFLIVFILASFWLRAGTVDVSAGSNMSSLRYNTGGDFDSNIYTGYSIVLNSMEDVVFAFDLFTPRFVNEPFIFSLGLQAYGIYIEKTDSILGGGGAFNLNLGYNFLTNIPTAISISGYYSPDTLNIEKVQEYKSYSVNYEIMFTPSGILYLGYTKADLFSEDGVRYQDEDKQNKEEHRYDLYEGWNVGVRLKF